MPGTSDPLLEVLSRVTTGRQTWRWRLRRCAVPVSAALGAVVLLSLLGIAASWTDGTAPAQGHDPPDATTVVASPATAPHDPRRSRAQAAQASPAAGRAAGAPDRPAPDTADDAPSAPPAAPQGAAPPAPAAPAALPALPALTSVRLAIGGGLTATLYAGQLDAVIRRLDGKVTFNTNGSFRSAYPRLCVATVVVERVSGREGAVFAHGLGSGWGGAEDVPDQRVAADNGTLHQQLVIPPSTARAGQRWTAWASVSVDGTQVATSGTYQLILDAVEGGSVWRWRVSNDGVTVQCQPY